MSTNGVAATITILHGATAETFDTAKKPAGGVHVARPDVTTDTIRNRMVQTSAPETVSSTVFVAGDTLWKHDADTGGLVACTVWSSGMVGRDVIRCTADRQVRARTPRRYHP